MDNNIDEIEKVIDEGANLNSFDVENAVKAMWERWEVLDDRAILELDESIDYLLRVRKAAIKHLRSNENPTDKNKPSRRNESE